VQKRVVDELQFSSVQFDVLWTSLYGRVTSSCLLPRTTFFCCVRPEKSDHLHKLPAAGADSAQMAGLIYGAAICRDSRYCHRHLLIELPLSRSFRRQYSAAAKRSFPSIRVSNYILSVFKINVLPTASAGNVMRSVMLVRPSSSSFNLSETIRYNTRFYFNMRSKADVSQLNLLHGTNN